MKQTLGGSTHGNNFLDVLLSMERHQVDRYLLELIREVVKLVQIFSQILPAEIKPWF